MRKQEDNSGMEIGTVIRRIRHAKQWTMERLCEEANSVVYSGHLSRIERNELMPSIYIVSKLARALNVSVDDMITESEGGKRAKVTPDPARKVPVISWVQAGEWTEIAATIGYEENLEWIIAPRKNIPPRSFALKVSGESMQSQSGRSFPDGSYILVNPDSTPDHKAFVVCTQADTNTATFKQLITDGTEKFLKPLNPQYPVLNVNENTIFCGTVYDMIQHIED